MVKEPQRRVTQSPAASQFPEWVSGSTIPRPSATARSMCSAPITLASNCAKTSSWSIAGSRKVSFQYRA